MKDVLEHLPDTVGTLEELYRITRPGARVYLTVPYWNSLTATGDPTHVRFFNEHSLSFFDPDAWQCRERPYYSRARFHIRALGVMITPFEAIGRVRGLTRDFTIRSTAGRKVLLVLASFFCNVVSGLEFHLERAS